MGHSPSKAVSTKPLAPITNYNPSYDVVKKFEDAHYGDVTLVKEKLTGREMLIKKVVANTKEAYEEEVRLFERRGGVTNNNVVKVIGYNVEEAKNFCSHFFNVSIFLEYYPKTVFDRVQEAMVHQSGFPESEVLFIAENLITGLAYFQTKNVSHGDIRPFNIFVGSDAYKLSDPTLGLHKGYNGFLAAKTGGYKTLLAPELLKHLPEKKPTVQSTVKSDVFSLGASLLSVATLTNSEDFYNYEKGLINEPLLNERLGKVRNTYSPFTFELIRDMLSINETTRPDFISLESRVAPYREKIRARTAIFVAKPVHEDDDILRRATEQLARSQDLRATLERNAAPFAVGQQGDNGRNWF